MELRAKFGEINALLRLSCSSSSSGLSELAVLRRLEDLVDAAERAETLLEACARAARASPQRITLTVCSILNSIWII